MLYSDMVLQAVSGAPRRGQLALGYQITVAYTLSALNFTKADLEALYLGTAAVSESDDALPSDAAIPRSLRSDWVYPQDSALP